MIIVITVAVHGSEKEKELGLQVPLEFSVAQKPGGLEVIQTHGSIIKPSPYAVTQFHAAGLEVFTHVFLVGRRTGKTYILSWLVNRLLLSHQEKPRKTKMEGPYFPAQAPGGHARH